MRFPASPGCGALVVVVGGPSPILAEGRGCGSPPLLAGVRWMLWCVSRPSWLRALGAVPRHSCLGSACSGWCLANPGSGPWWQVPAIHGWSQLLLVVGGPSPILAEGPGGGSPPLLARVRWLLWWLVPRQS